VRQSLAQAVRAILLPDTTGLHLRIVYKLMGDPRNVAHAKKVTQEKHHKGKNAQKARAPQPAKKAQFEKTKPAAAEQSAAPKPEAEKPPQPPDSAQLEKSLAVLSKLKELEFHSRANIEKLAELSLTIEEELKQKAFTEAVGTVYAAQNAFQSKILELIDAYEAECARLSGSA
jgi:hypothetical protein